METWLFPATEDRQSFPALAPENVDAPAAKPAAATCLRKRRRSMRGEPSRSLHIVESTTPSRRTLLNRH